MNVLLEDLRYDDLTKDLKLLADVLGMDTVKVLLTELSGLNFYIPHIQSLEDPIRRFIEKNPTLTDKQIAVKLGVSEVYIRKFTKK